MRIAIAGLHGEQSTFTRNLAGPSYLLVTRGEEMMAEYDFAARLGADVADVEWVPTVRAMGTASGPIPAEYYDPIVEETFAALEAGGPYDGVYLELHGAMHVEGRDHAEEEYVRRIREIVGPEVPISASMDTHGNLSRELAELLDLAAAHRLAPHSDNYLTRHRAVRNLIEVIRRGERPHRAWVRIPVLLPGERTSTNVEPGKSVFGGIVPAMERHGVLDANIWIGFAWADEDRNAAAVLVTSWDEESARACAAELARSYWEAREDFVIVIDHSGSWAEGIEFLLGDAARPVFLSDAGDNVRAGGSGDVTFALAATKADPRLAEAGARILFAGIWDPDALGAALVAGEGAVIERALGAVVDDRYAAAVPGRWRVDRFVDGMVGEGTVGAVLTDGPVSVIVHDTVAPFIGPGDPTSPKFPWRGALYTDISGYDAVVVKNGYQFPTQLALAGSSFMAITPGGTDLDVDRLRFAKVWRPIYPLDTDFAPDLTPHLL